MARDHGELLDFAVALAREAGASTLELFQSPTLRVRDKDDGTPVTEADSRAERLLRERLERRAPGDAIVGEEEGETPGTSGRRWFLDPIDGTVSFLHGVPLYGTLIGLEEEGEMVLGVCHLPALGETVAAARGLGARWYRGDAPPVPARVSAVDRLSDALLCYTGYTDRREDERLGRLRAAVSRCRGWSDCYAHVLVATGRAELVYEPAMNAWDCAPFPPILAEAGGTFTDLAGRATIHGGDALATNGRLLEATLRAMEGR